MKALALALIEAAAWLERHDGDWSVDVYAYNNTVTISQWVSEQYDYDTETTVSAVDRMAALRREIGGTWDKNTTSYEFSLTHNVTENLMVKLSVSREAACTPRVVGTEEVEVRDYDACPKK